jgi:predicted alpha-1,2-mannosidase
MSHSTASLRILAGCAAVLLTAASLSVLQSPSPAHAADLALTGYVNPFVGTDDSNSPNPVGGGAGGSTYPGAVVPFGMTQFSPDTPTGSPSGYRDSDRTIESFSLTHFNGAGCPNNEDLPILPITGSLGSSPGSSWTSYASAYTKSNETASPGYYKNRLDKYSTDVELSATARTGAMKLTFPATTAARVLINSSRTSDGDRDGNVTIAGNRVYGEHTAGNFCGSWHYYKIYYSILFDRTPTAVGTFKGATVSAGSTTTSGTQTGAYVTFDTTGNAVVNATVGISFVSVANAQANATAEAGAFATVRANADAAWNTALNRVQATGGSSTDLQKFYTALYHVLMNPNIASDTNGQYLGFDGAVHTSSSPIYQNYSGWDIYRSWASLVALIAPDVMTDIVKSMILDGQQGGLLPKWSQQTQEDFVMPGDPGPIIVASAYAFGVRSFDTAAALALMKKSATGGSTQGSVLRGNEATYESAHFIAGNPSETLEYASSDFAIANFAKALGDTSGASTYSAHSQYWRSLFNGESSYLHTRTSGGWSANLNPATESPYVEGNAAQYTWMVPHNYGALVTLMGGPTTAAQRLDHHFQQLNGGLSSPYFYIGNEPEHSVPWAYNFARKPAGTSSAVRRVMAESYTTGAGGLPGNDDLGATSAWYVWAALGMFPVTPGADTLAVHGALFPSAVIKRSAGDITITGGSATNQYVQSLSVNGTSTSHNYLTYGDIGAGATVAFTMGSGASSWGTGASDVPPSFADGATQPPAEPDLGPNLALNKTATAAAACNSSEAAAKAVDGTLVGNSKWCSGTSPYVLTTDLGSAQTVSSFVVKHAGLGGEQTNWNTGAFTISTSTDNATWSTAVTVTGSKSSRTYSPIPPRTARYVRFEATTPTNDGGTAARIYELEVYGQSSAPTDLALRKTVTADSSCGATEGPDKAVNGSVLGGWVDKWCSQGTSKWLQVDLGSTQHVGSVVLRHAGAGGEYPAWNTKDFDLQTSADASTWTTRAQIRGNTADTTTTTINIDARYVRLNVVTPTSTTDTAARIYEVDVRS